MEPLSQGESGIDQVEKEAGRRFHARVRGCFAGPEIEVYCGLLYDLPRLFWPLGGEGIGKGARSGSRGKDRGTVRMRRGTPREDGVRGQAFALRVERRIGGCVAEVAPEGCAEG